MEPFENTPKFLLMSLTEAREKGLLEEWRNSDNANHECRAALAPKINLANNPDEMQAALLWGARHFGLQRVIALLTLTVQNLEHDGRIDRDNKEWAAQFDFSALGNTAYLSLNAHATRINYAMPYIINAYHNLDTVNRMYDTEAIFDAPEQEDDIEL